MQNTLFLIPTTLGENWDTIPQEVKDLASNLEVFIVENLRSARRHLRKMGNQKDFDTEVTFFELDKHKDNFEELFTFINEHKDKSKNMGLLSEAGNPCIADPGSGAVDLAHQLGLIVKPLVGPSSILLALIASGFNGQQFSFNGYLPIDDKEKRIALKKLESAVLQTGFTQIFMETPYRNDKLVDEMISSLRPETKLCIAVELGEASEFIETRQLKNWKSRPNLHKRPAVFVLGR